MSIAYRWIEATPPPRRPRPPRPRGITITITIRGMEALRAGLVVVVTRGGKLR